MPNPFKANKSSTKSAVLLEAIPFEDCLAKTWKTDLSILPGRTVLSHCHIVGEVARKMIHRMPDWLSDDLFPAGSELVAAAHDIGKVSPTFQKKLYLNLSEKNDRILSKLSDIDQDTERLWGGHGGVSQATIESKGIEKYIPEILGQHHGFSPDLSRYDGKCAIFGGDIWYKHRLTLIETLKGKLKSDDFPKITNLAQVSALSGLTTVADWVGSGNLFSDPNDESWPNKIDLALDEAGFVAPSIKADLSFKDIFGFEPRNAQTKLIETANQAGVYIFEAPMGLGKTEAALYVAYSLLSRNLATGIYFALPTQLSSDKIRERVDGFLIQILDESSHHKGSLLLYGSAKLKMGEEVNPGGAWFAQGKRGILAPFAVGTIDQALMAVMNVKHGFVRAFGLAGKVVILDEVHSYDSYTGTILDELVKTLRQLHCTVIILSATLTFERRSFLLGERPVKTNYPLITGLPKHSKLTEVLVEEIQDVTVTIAHHSDKDALDEALRRAAMGQQVLWIENTVNKAQSIYKVLAARAKPLGVDCGLLHSRFIKTDRALIEEKWVNLFGKSGLSSRARQGRILVGTQVLEQSLDIDADFLVTRIAPTDMLLQRLGRLWRHDISLRSASAKREAWILAPKFEFALADTKEAFGSTARVYAPYVLLRSVQVWENILAVNLPSDIRHLIEKTYDARDESDEMLKHLHQIEINRNKLKGLALRGLSKGGTTQSEESAQTRHSELETTEVLLIQNREEAASKKGSWVTLLNNQKIWVPLNGRTLSPGDWRDLSSTLMQNTVKVAEYLAPGAVSREQLSWLNDYFYLGRAELSEKEVPLRVALVKKSGEVRSIGATYNEDYAISYENEMGYQTTKKRSYAK